jgi:hypothetical protein
LAGSTTKQQQGGSLSELVQESPTFLAETKYYENPYDMTFEENCSFSWNRMKMQEDWLQMHTFYKKYRDIGPNNKWKDKSFPADSTSLYWD